jgi:hypothetical protein
MSGTRSSSWRSLLAFAPALGVVAVTLAVVQGTTELATTRGVYLVLAPLSALGWLAARSLGKASDRPVVSIGLAQPGAVALHGVARPFPGQSPSKAPDGTDCLWFTAFTKKTPHISSRKYYAFSSSDSVAPFLLDDGNGQCIVLPAGAEVSGGHDGSSTLMNGTYIRDGDRLFVAGLLKPPSMEVIQATQSALETAAREPRLGVTQGEPQETWKPSHVPLSKPDLTDVSLVSAIPVPALPLVCAGGGPFVIVAGDGESDSSFYGLLKIVNVVVLLASLAMCAWLTLRVASG